jgi:uncharacterized protein
MAGKGRAVSLRTSGSGIWLEQPAHAVSLRGPRLGLWLGALLSLAVLAFFGLALLYGRPAAVNQVAIPAVARVTDLTGTLDTGEQAALSAKLADFEHAGGAQLAVLVLPSTRPETIEQYGIRLAETWKLGRKGVDDGVILIVAKDDHKLRIEVGYGLEGSIPDAVASRIIEETIVPAFKAGDFYQGIDAGVDRIIRAAQGVPQAVDAVSAQTVAPLPAAAADEAPAAEPPAAPSEEQIQEQYAEEQRRSDRAEHLVLGVFIFSMVFAAVARSWLGTIGAAFAAGALFAGFCLLLSRWLVLDALPLAGGGGLLVCALSWAGISGWRSGGFGGGSGSGSSSGGSGGFSGGGGGFGGGGASGSW